MIVPLVNQRPDLGPAVHCEPPRTGHDCRSPGRGIDGFCFAASRRVSLLCRDGHLNKESLAFSQPDPSENFFLQKYKVEKPSLILWPGGAYYVIFGALSLHPFGTELSWSYLVTDEKEK